MADIKVCQKHQERLTPLLHTFAFPRCELWCAWCGFRGGLFGTGESVPETPELEARYNEDEKRSQAFLIAQGRTYAAETFHAGEWVKPATLPEDVKEFDRRVIANWRYPAELHEEGRKA
jgi:hypothetical protein